MAKVYAASIDVMEIGSGLFGRIVKTEAGAVLVVGETRHEVDQKTAEIEEEEALKLCNFFEEEYQKIISRENRLHDASKEA